MEFFLELLLTAVVALLFSFLVAKLVSVSMAAGVNDRSSDQAEKTEIGVGDGFVTVEELRFGLKMDAPVIQSERTLRVVVDENVEHVDRLGSEADRVVDEADEEILAAVSQENVIATEMIARGEEEIGDEREELIVSTAEAESTASVSPENVIAEEGNEPTKSRSDCAESEEVRVEESNSVEKRELNTEEQEELSIEDDWEGIERSELEKDFAAASNLLEESGKGEEIGAEAKMKLYGLHKVATEGSCREAQPMAVMVSARAKWNAWQRLGNMSQEEAMEQYLALVSKEFPGLMNTTDHTLGKMPETETSVDLPPNSGSSKDSTTLDTTGVASSKTVSGER